MGRRSRNSPSLYQNSSKMGDGYLDLRSEKRDHQRTRKTQIKYNNFKIVKPGMVGKPFYDFASVGPNRSDPRQAPVRTWTKRDQYKNRKGNVDPLAWGAIDLGYCSCPSCKGYTQSDIRRLRTADREFIRDTIEEEYEFGKYSWLDDEPMFLGTEYYFWPDEDQAEYMLFEDWWTDEWDDISEEDSLVCDSEGDSASIADSDASYDLLEEMYDQEPGWVAIDNDDEWEVMSWWETLSDIG